MAQESQQNRWLWYRFALHECFVVVCLPGILRFGFLAIFRFASVAWCDCGHCRYSASIYSVLMHLIADSDVLL